MPIALDALASPPMADTTGRDTEVPLLAALGWTTARNRRRLGITPWGVKFHLASIYRTLGAANGAEASLAYLKREMKD